MTAKWGASSATEGGTVESAGPSSSSAKDAVARALERFSQLAGVVDRSPRVLIDGHCNVLWQSRGAERLLQPPLPLWIEGAKLYATGGLGNMSWPSFVENMNLNGARLLLMGGEPGTWVLVRGWADQVDDYRFAFIKAVTSWPLCNVASSGLATDFGLTRSECRVLDEFARLRKPNEIAERLKVSLSTVRSHLKQIHAKVGVNSSIQLLRIIRAYTDT